MLSLVRNKPNGTVECLVQEVPHFLIEEFMLLFPGLSLHGERLNVVTLSERTVNDMTGWSEAVSLWNRKESNF